MVYLMGHNSEKEVTLSLTRVAKVNNNLSLVRLVCTDLVLVLYTTKKSQGYKLDWEVEKNFLGKKKAMANNVCN